jgi:CRISPR-associated protein Csx10
MRRIQLRITALSPLAIGGHKPGGSISEVETYIPGTVIRGSIAGLMIRQANSEGIDFANDPTSDFKTLFIDGGAIFQNAYPAIAEVSNDFQVRPDVKVLPATVLSAKASPGFRPKGNGMFDSLLDRFCAEQFGQIYDPNCPVDGGRVDPVKGFYSSDHQQYAMHSTSTRLLTRVGINRRRATAEDQILYSTQVLEEFKRQNVPMVFSCSILVVDALAEEFVQYLNQNANSLRLGGGVSRGLGKVELELEVKETVSDLSDRLNQLNAALKGRWQLWKLFDGTKADPSRERLFFTIGLQSDAILTEQWRRTTVISETIFRTAVGSSSESIRLEAAHSSYDYRSGWNSAWGLMKDTELMTDRGSVYLFSVDKREAEHWITHLTELENSGIGDRISEGFGQVRVCDEFHSVFRERAV